MEVPHVHALLVQQFQRRRNHDYCRHKISSLHKHLNLIRLRMWMKNEFITSRDTSVAQKNNILQVWNELMSPDTWPSWSCGLSHWSHDFVGPHFLQMQLGPVPIQNNETMHFGINFDWYMKLMAVRTPFSHCGTLYWGQLSIPWMQMLPLMNPITHTKPAPTVVNIRASVNILLQYNQRRCSRQ